MKHKIKEWADGAVPQNGDVISTVTVDGKRATFLVLGRSMDDCSAACAALGLKFLGFSRYQHGGSALPQASKRGLRKAVVPETVLIRQAGETDEQVAARGRDAGQRTPPVVVDQWVWEVRATVPKGWVAP